jgi:leucyl-tRNA synthetase
VLYPIVPHITAQLWTGLGYGQQFGDILDAPWPRPDESALARDRIELVIQVNGKLRGRVSVPADAGDEQVRALALAEEGVARHTQGKPVRKVIVVPGKLVNIVV